jgi:hypothetical protein
MKYLVPLAIFFCSLVSASDPTYKLRLYDSQAKYLVANLEANQLHKADTTYARMEVYLLPNIDLPSLHARLNQLRSLGIKAIPGMRTMPDAKISDYVSGTFWQKPATELAAVAAMRAKDDPRVYIDMENYVTDSEASEAVINPLGGKAALAKAMAPFLDVIKSQKIVPCMTPGVIGDLAEQLCAEAACSSEWLDETLFDAEANYRNNYSTFAEILIDTHKVRRAVLDKFPTAKWTPGFTDSAMRVTSKPFNNGPSQAFGESDRWIFLRERYDEKLLGTKEWLSGLSLNPLNDALYIPLRKPLGLREWSGAGSFKEAWINSEGQQVDVGHAGPRLRDPVTDDAYWPAARRFLIDQTGTLAKASKPFTLACDVLVTRNEPTALGGVWLARQNGYESYQVKFANDAWSIDFATPKVNDRDIIRAGISIPAKREQWQRLVLTIGADKVSLSVNGVAQEIAAKVRDVAGIPFCLGVGERGLFADSLRVRNLHVWNRVLSAQELAKVRSSVVYPFGK